MQVEIEEQKLVCKTFNLFQVIILNNSKYKALNKSLYEWLELACYKFPTKVVNVKKNDAIFEILQNCISNIASHMIVLFASTPLITAETLDQIVEYANIKNVKACKLPLGYVFKNEYLKNNIAPEFDSLFTHAYEEFYNVEYKKQLNMITEILRKRVVDYHIQNGVNIVNPASVTIEPEVDIASGVEIFSNNVLKGKTQVKAGVILKENNVISNSKVFENCCLSHSVVEDSILEQNVYIKPFCDILHSRIKANTILNSHTTIENDIVVENIGKKNENTRS